ncbi:MULTISPECIES: hypothetical protein [unclassified Arthrobacter]|uniref:DUF7847 domain-containing protein n=1 Tax=unclassified Arthrobacter TaxID=235627 RepID=UPI001F0F9084|nr:MULTISPECIES: hypothetical protein [unclassified Arthrobacter]
MSPQDSDAQEPQDRQAAWRRPSGQQTPGPHPPGHEIPGQQPPGWQQAPQQPWGPPTWQQPSPQQPWGQPGSAYPGPPQPRYPSQHDPNQHYPNQGTPFGQPRYVAPPKPGIVPLRPLMFGEIMDGSFQVIRRNAKAMLGASLLAQSLAAILTAVLTAATATSMDSVEAWASSTSDADLAALGLGFAAAVLLVAVLTLFIASVLQGAMVVPVARSILNRPTSFKQMWSLARPRVGALVRLAALLMAATLLAMLVPAALAVALTATMQGMGILLLIPLFLGFVALYVWIYVKLMVAPAAVVIEELGARAGLRRSWELTRANWWRILGITLVVGIMVAIVSQIVMIPVGLLPPLVASFLSPHGGNGQDMAIAVAIGIVTAILGALAGALGYAFQTSVMALIYMDLRMRKDGLDISLLRQMETGADPDGVPGRGHVTGRPGWNHNGGNPGPGPAAGAWPDGR